MLVPLTLLVLQIPGAAYGYRRDMERSAWRVFGPGAPVATLAAQIHQESGWKEQAVSWVGARGLAQFMPSTAEDMARLHPQSCAPADPFSPSWAFRCRDLYLRGLLRAVRTPALPECGAWSFALRAYNGGLGWVRRDRALAAARGIDPDDWAAVGAVNAGRRPDAHRENKEYPERIHRIALRYERAGWGGVVC